MKISYRKKGFVGEIAVMAELWIVSPDGEFPQTHPKFGTILPVCAPINEIRTLKTEDIRAFEFRWLDQDGVVEILAEILVPSLRFPTP